MNVRPRFDPLALRADTARPARLGSMLIGSGLVVFASVASGCVALMVAFAEGDARTALALSPFIGVAAGLTGRFVDGGPPLAVSLIAAAVQLGVVGLATRSLGVISDGTQGGRGPGGFVALTVILCFICMARRRR